ncbi:MAG: cobalamin biosynthesis protein CbiX, partial [Roseicyclus sp.]
MTPAAPGALQRAVDALPQGRRLLVAPHFMADGWFVRAALRRRLKAAGAGPFDLLATMGLLPGLARLAARRAEDAAIGAGFDPLDTRVAVAGHGAPADPRPAEVVRRCAERLPRYGGFAEVTVGFVEQAPFLETALAVPAPALSLPFFAAAGEHVTVDLPEAGRHAGFGGPIPPPIGADDATKGVHLTIVKEPGRWRA